MILAKWAALLRLIDQYGQTAILKIKKALIGNVSTAH